MLLGASTPPLAARYGAATTPLARRTWARTTTGEVRGMDVLVITDKTDREELAEYLSHLCAFAKRQQRIVGNGETKWDQAHRKMDGALDDWLKAEA